MNSTILVVMFALLVLCAMVNVLEEMFPNKIPGFVKPILFAATLMMAIPVFDFLFNLFGMDLIKEFFVLGESTMLI